MPKWLKCKITKGMFSDEYTIIVRTRTGENIAVFVPKDSAQEQSSRVKVKVLGQADHMLAVLPDANQSEIDVDASELLPA